jgi:glycogen operon protein
VLWLRPDGTEMKEDDWKFPEGRFLAYVLAPTTNGGEPLLVVFNGAQQEIELTLPPWEKVAHWTKLLDTSTDAAPVEGAETPSGAKLPVPAESILAFAGQP